MNNNPAESTKRYDATKIDIGNFKVEDRGDGVRKVAEIE
jgi:hypothetical protein